MLEIKNLVKTYIPKKGVPVVALNRVSLQIEETGLVFILGKSGSGKSTLLNLLGGLDKYDEGDIVIKGKSTKNFTQSNFDSYRNTYVGFIFQEYNILDEFSVGANIALAIELQGRKASNEEVNEILDILDLSNFGSRRPNELSGGQKQRVAIARALVKKPNIILADEPTGALDSKTGIQIFDILKKLAKDKLVLVVSHDREFAEKYGDRVIELADGKVISDIKKQVVKDELEQDLNIQYDEKEGMIVKEGYKLTDKDLTMINQYLEKNKTLSLVTKPEQEFSVRNLFVNTKDNLNIKKYSEEFSMIKSKLPFKMSFRIGASALKYKKFRLIFTILLSLIAFTLFGIADSMAAYNKIDATVNSIIDGGIDAVSFAKTRTRIVKNGDYEWENTRELFFSDEDIENLNNKIGKNVGLQFKPVYTGGNQDKYSRISLEGNFASMSTINYGYYNNALSGLVEYSEEEIQDLGFTLVGEMPKADDEIVITDYTFEHFVERGYSNSERSISIQKPGNYSEIVGKYIVLPIEKAGVTEIVSFKISGIIDTKLNTKKYESLKNPPENEIGHYILREEFMVLLNYGYHALGYVNEGYIKKLVANNSANGINVRNVGYIEYFFESQKGSIYPEAINKVANYDGNIYYFDKEKTSLAKGEIIVGFDYIREHMGEIKADDFTGTISDYEAFVINVAFQEYVDAHYSEAEKYCKAIKQDDNTPEESKKNIYKYYLMTERGFQKNDYGSKSGREIYNETWDSKMKSIINEFGLDIKVQRSYYDNEKMIDNPVSFGKIVGVHISPVFSSRMRVVVDDEFYDSLAEYGEIAPYSFALAKMPKSRSDIKKIAIFSYEKDDDGIAYPLRNSVTPMLDLANDMVEEVAKIFLYIGIGFATFSGLMLSNFIGTSVSRKKREIGILRALGARSSDVFGIFFNESLVIAAINFVLSSISTMILVGVINRSLRGDAGLTVTIFNFSIRQVVLLILISVFVALVASYLPVSKIARKKPVDAIHNK